MGRVGFQFFPQPADMDHKSVIVPHQRPLPEGRAEGIHRNNISPGFPQLFQKGIFLGGKGDFLPLPPEDSLSPVDAGVPQPGCGGFLPVDPAKHRPQPEEKFLGQKGLVI